MIDSSYTTEKGRQIAKLVSKPVTNLNEEQSCGFLCFISDDTKWAVPTVKMHGKGQLGREEKLAP